MQSFQTTPSQENYIEWIYRLSRKGPVKSHQLADKLGIKRSSVTRSVNTLVKMGLVLHESHRDITLTENGAALGKALVRRDECLTRLLVDVLGMDAEAADPEVHRLEHVLSNDVLIRLEELVAFSLSSNAWLKRLNHRINSARVTGESEDEISLGCAPLHSGNARKMLKISLS